MSLAREKAKKRFSEKIEIDPDTNCWLWTAAKTETGYGRFRGEKGKTVAAHRWAYENFRGKIPEGKGLDHRCRVRHCVNPEHLEPATQWQNVHRGKLSDPVKCRNGHQRTSKNTIHLRKRLKDGTPVMHRQCRICYNASQRRVKAKKRAALKAARDHREKPNEIND